MSSANNIALVIAGQHQYRVAAKATRLHVLNGFIAGRVAAGEIVALPPFLYEMLIIGPVAEVAQRWLAAPAAHDLRLAAKHLPERIWRSVAAQEE